MTDKQNPILIDGMTCPYCSKECKTQGLPEPTFTDGGKAGVHIACFCPCHALAQSVNENKLLTEELRKVRKENEKLRSFKASVEQSLNSGNGTYKP